MLSKSQLDRSIFRISQLWIVKIFSEALTETKRVRYSVRKTNCMCLKAPLHITPKICSKIYDTLKCPYFFKCSNCCSLCSSSSWISLPDRDALGSDDVPATVGILQAHTRRTGCCHTAPVHRIYSWGRILGSNWDKLSSLLFTLTARSVVDPRHFVADPYPRIRTTDYWIPIRLRIRIQLTIRLLSSGCQKKIFTVFSYNLPRHIIFSLKIKFLAEVLC